MIQSKPLHPVHVGGRVVMWAYGILSYTTVCAQIQPNALKHIRL